MEDGFPHAMTKSQLIELLSARHNQLSPKDAELAVKTMLDAMAQALALGNRIEIRGFGSFGLNFRPPESGATRRRASGCRCRASTCRTSRPARNCVSVSTAIPEDGALAAPPEGRA